MCLMVILVLLSVFFWAKENALNKDVVVVDYDGNEITYLRSDLTELTHAYCTSIHKAQGSEFPIVIMPIVKQYFRMLQNRFYILD